jgi:hypothetical protein
MNACGISHTFLVFSVAALALPGCSNPRQTIDTSLDEVSSAAGSLRQGFWRLRRNGSARRGCGSCATTLLLKLH